MLRRFRLDPRSVRADAFPVEGSTRDKMLFLLRFAVLAPSVHNTQPWRFSIDRERIGLFVDRRRWMPEADPDQRDLYLSLGCLLENLIVAARHYGYAPQVDYAPRRGSHDYIARVDLSRKAAATPGDAQFDAIKRRRVSYDATLPKLVTPAVLEDLARAVGDDAVLYVTRDAAIREGAARLFADASAMRFARPAFREELGRWLREGEYGLFAPFKRLRRLGLAQLERDVRSEAKRIAAAPYLGVLLIEKEDPVSLVRAGRAFERLWLAAALRDVSLRPASALCAVRSVRSNLASLIDASRYPIAQAFRLGPVKPRSPRTPRRRPEELILAVPLSP